MFKRSLLARFNIFLSLFAMLLVTVCPVITQTIALLEESSALTPRYTAASNHFECASQFYKENNLNPNDFLELSNDVPLLLQTDNTAADITNSDVNCGYCDLLHTASIAVTTHTNTYRLLGTELIIIDSTPFLSSRNFWSILTRAPPSQVSS